MERNQSEQRRSTSGLSLAFAAGVLQALVGAANGQTIAYDGFAYPQGAMLTAVGNGGVGWLGGWNVASPGNWTIDSQGSKYSRGFKRLVQTGNRIHGSSAGTQRTLAGTTLGNTTETVWVSFIAQQTYGPSNSNWLGVKLPCVVAPGVNSFLFLGKPFSRASWGMDSGSVASHRWGAESPYLKSFVIARIDLRPGLDDVRLWVNPSLASAPSNATASVTSLAYGNFEGITKAITEIGSTSGLTTGHIDELRIGREFQDVAPVTRGFGFRGFQAEPLGMIILENTSPDMLSISNIGGTGNDGVRISMESLSGSTLEVRPGAMPEGAHMTVVNKNWDGEAVSATTWRRTPAGDHEMVCDFSGRSDVTVSSVQIQVYDEAGNLVHDQTTAGPTASVPITAGVVGGNGGLCSDGLPPRWYLDEVLDPFEQRLVVTSVFGCPNGLLSPTPRWSVWVYANFNACSYCTNVGGSTGTHTTDVTATGMDDFALLYAASNFGGVHASGMGDAALSEACSDGTLCVDPGTRTLSISNIGGTGQDGVQLRVPDGGVSSMSMTMGGLDSLATAVPARISTNFTVAKSSGEEGSVTASMERTSDSRVMMAIDAAQFDDANLVVTVRDGGTVVGTVQGTTSTIRVYVDGMLQYVTESSFLAWIFINNFAYGMVTPPGVGGLTFTIDDGNTAHAFVGDAIDFQLLSNEQAVSVVGASIVGQNLSGSLLISDVEIVQLPDCLADFNQDGFLDFFDYDGYVGAFEAGTPDADFNADGFIDFFDYSDFVGAFEVGC